MDPFQILIFLLIVVLPLIQALLERSKGSRPPPGESGEEGDEWEEMPAEHPTSRQPTWSTEWGEWPTGEDVEDEEIVPAEIVGARTAPDEEELIDRLLKGRLARADAELQRRAETRVVSLEPLHVDRSGPRPPTVHTPPVLGAAATARPTRLVRLLRRPESLRNAVILSEIIGKPRGLSE